MKRLTAVASLALSLAGGLPQPARAQIQESERNGGSAAIAERPVGVSPGAAHAFELAAGACPTFSWAAAPDAAGYELVVYGVDQGDAAPALEVGLPAGASSWTPAADSCLAPGRYAWTVRAEQRTDHVGQEQQGQERSGRWSEALLFEVGEAPTVAELQRALEVVQRYLGTARVGEETLGTAEADISPTRAVAAVDSPRPWEQAAGGGGPATAVRGEVPDAAGETYGVRGVANSPDGAGVRADNNAGAGADLVLGGSPVAEITESSFSRSSASNLTFDFTNPDAGTMTLQADGNALFHAGNDGSGSGLDADLLDGLDSTAFLSSGTDDWVDETGDAMSGLLTIDPASGFALQTGTGDAIDLGGDLYKSGQLFLHNPGALNTGVGAGALNPATTGQQNTALGGAALSSNPTGARNTALGDGTLLFNTAGQNNTAVGSSALSANTATGNTAVGAFALVSNTAAGSNTAIGFSALRNTTTGQNNTAVGSYALFENTSGLNTAIGQSALRDNTTGNRNTASGRYALRNNTTGSSNTASGVDAAFSNTTGSRNVAIGYNAGQFATTGNDNIFIGSGTVGTAGDSGVIRIGSGAQTATFIDGVHGVTVAGGIGVFINSDGQLGTTPSSRRFKEEIRDVGRASEALLALRPVSFRYTKEAAGEGERPLEYGLIAEEVAEVFPELVVYDREGRPETVRYHLLVPLLVAELQRERATLEQQHGRIRALLVRLEALEGRRERLPAVP